MILKYIYLHSKKNYLFNLLKYCNNDKSGYCSKNF